MNLVVINCHDLGQHLGCYGHSTVPSPNIDALAERGVRFENSFCTAPQCSPSRATLYTGRYAHANGMFGLAHAPFNWRLNEDEIHLAQYLQDAGYTTAHFGIQHVTAFNEEAVQALGYQHAFIGHDNTEEIINHATAFLTQDHEQPFFVNVGFFNPHRDDQGLFKQAPPDNSLGVEVPPYLPDTPEARAELADLQGAIAALDDAVGAIIDVLEAHNLLDETWLVFTTDHGLAMPRAKCTMYDPGIETALIMLAKPLDFAGGRVISEMVSHVDFVPTILETFDLPVPDRIQGRSYHNLLMNEAYDERDTIFAEKTYHTAYEPQRMIRTMRYKLILNLEVDIINVPADIQHSPIYPQMIDTLTAERPQFELYDLQADPLESNNLAGSAEVAGIEADLRRRLLEWMQTTDDPILEGPIASPYYHKAIRLLEEA